MSSVVHKRIRRLYYIGSLIVIAFTTSVLSIFFFSSIWGDYRGKVEQLADGILDQKKTYIRTVILEKISDIEWLWEMRWDDAQRKGQVVVRLLSQWLDTRPDGVGLVERFRVFAKGTELEAYDFALKRGERVLSTSLGPSDTMEDFTVVASTTLADGSTLTALVAADVIRETVMEKAEENIRTAVLPDEGYIWVNQILNYDGGDNYAVRLVHPNLSDTEGMLLSTSMTDTRGNHPYLEELNGVKADGEVFLEYYFPKMNSDLISHKLSFGKLYKPFDWVIATGIYLDDLDALVKAESLQLTRSFWRELGIMAVIILVSFGLAGAAIVMFETRIHSVITGFTARIEEMAFEDGLTGLLNRRAMTEQLDSEISRASRGGYQFCVIMADLDQFKSINDTHGHPMGDLVLKEVGAIIQRNVRREDRAARWGGEEFLILVTSASQERGVVVAEKIRSAVEATVVRGPEREIGVTLTLGVASYRPADQIDKIVSRADMRLYAGKAAGRNCVVGRAEDSA